MASPDATIFVVDDDASVRKALKRLIRSAGHSVTAFSSAAEFLAHDHNFEAHGCLVLDINMPGLSGLELQERMVSAGLDIPIIFITGHGSVPASVRAMKAGAVDFLEKPFEDQALLDAVAHATAKDVRTKQLQAEIGEIQQRAATLTPREHEVFVLVAAGMLNRQIALELGASEKTIKVHRARVMQKMSAESLADLVRLAEKAGVNPPKPGMK
ncbi:MAG: response regulator transcription factor [Deltaproteobacteria bacterium]|nr:response regulator transcription factor [Deltaproteobacteria bacterium]